MKTVAFISLGCKVNTYETQAMEHMLKKDGFLSVSFDEAADIYVINTCVVTQVADKKSRQLLRRARKKNPQALIVACGCYVHKDADFLIKNGLCDLIISNNEKGTLSQKIKAYLHASNPQTQTVVDIHQKDTLYEELDHGTSFDRARAFVKIQDGCDMKCSYCIIPKVRGKSRSRFGEDILREVQMIAGAGYSEVVLTGVHLSSYLSADKKRLLDIISDISAIDSIRRIRFGSVEPTVFTKDFVQRLSVNDKVCAHFHLSMQSGCNKTLKAMNRHYDTDSILFAVDTLRNAWPNAGVSADIIAGFPGETIEDHQETIALVEKIALSDSHIFPFSKREGTKAYDMPDAVSNAEKEKRAKELISITNESKAKFRKNRMGKPLSVLFETTETIDGKTYWSGYSREYIPVFMESSEDLSRVIVENTASSMDEALNLYF